jgi:collagen type V/XI/XXIV/XXVII, alpha
VYGYEVNENGQFHHEVRAPDGVTYGCYGYLDPDGKPRATHYVADAWGYRVVIPGKPVDIWVKKPGTEDFEMQTVPYEKSYFPKGCGTGPGGILPGDARLRPSAN